MEQHADPLCTPIPNDDATDGDVVAAALTTEPAPAATGEKRLMRAVLVDAIQVYLERFGATGVIERRELAEVQRWFRSADRQWPFAFENVCEALGLDPERVRRALRTARDAPRRIRPGSAPAVAARREAAAAPVDSPPEAPLMCRTAC